MCMKASSFADPARGVGVEKGLEEFRKVEKGSFSAALRKRRFASSGEGFRRVQKAGATCRGRPPCLPA